MTGSGGSARSSTGGSGGGFTISSNMLVWDQCDNTENYVTLVASTYDDNLYSQIKNSESSYNGVDVTDSTDFKKYVKSSRIPINFYAFSFDGILLDQSISNMYEISLYDKSRKFVTKRLSLDSCSGSVIIYEPKGVVLNKTVDTVHDENIISICDAKKDKSIVTKKSTGGLYCVYNSSVDKLVERGWAK